MRQMVASIDMNTKAEDMLELFSSNDPKIHREDMGHRIVNCKVCELVIAVLTVSGYNL
jgi:hypothetical protein